MFSVHQTLIFSLQTQLRSSISSMLGSTGAGMGMRVRGVRQLSKSRVQMELQHEESALQVSNNRQEEGQLGWKIQLKRRNFLSSIVTASKFQPTRSASFAIKYSALFPVAVARPEGVLDDGDAVKGLIIACDFSLASWCVWESNSLAIQESSHLFGQHKGPAELDNRTDLCGGGLACPWWCTAYKIIEGDGSACSI